MIMYAPIPPSPLVAHFDFPPVDRWFWPFAGPDERRTFVSTY